MRFSASGFLLFVLIRLKALFPHLSSRLISGLERVIHTTSSEEFNSYTIAIQNSVLKRKGEEWERKKQKMSSDEICDIWKDGDQ